MTTPRLRIALVAACPFPSPQGSQVFVAQMAERLGAAGHDVHLLTYGQGSRQSGRGYRHHRLPRLPGDDATASGPNVVKPLLDAMLALRLAALTREQRIDVVHAHNYEAAVAALAARAITGVPVVYHSHNLMGDELETYFAGAGGRRLAAMAGRFLDRNVPRRADYTIALCDLSAQRLREAGCDRVSVIPPAVDDDGPLAGSAAARRSLGLGDDDFVVGYCGNLDRYQNLDLLMAAMRRLPAATTRLLLVTHARPDAVRRTVDRAGLAQRLVVVEARSHADACRAMAVFDVVALPRRLGSGYPVKLLNSMSAAKAVVTAGCGSKVLRDGVDGIVVADDDADALADGIDRCRRDAAMRVALGAQARRTFLGQLTWEVVLPQIEGVYAGLREPVVDPEQRPA